MRTSFYYCKYQEVDPIRSLSWAGLSILGLELTPTREVSKKWRCETGSGLIYPDIAMQVLSVTVDLILSRSVSKALARLSAAAVGANLGRSSYWS